jgi:pyruvate/2-oxoglutarate/acetoin dehydrogenase E1 component
MQESLFGRLRAAVRRVAAVDIAIPAARTLERAVLPADTDIENAIFEVLE